MIIRTLSLRLEMRSDFSFLTVFLCKGVKGGVNHPLFRQHKEPSPVLKTILFFVAKHTFHFLICIEVFKRSFANQTFIIHICYPDKLEFI